MSSALSEAEIQDYIGRRSGGTAAHISGLTDRYGNITCIEQYSALSDSCFYAEELCSFFDQ
jgi:hypothetical protein